MQTAAHASSTTPTSTELARRARSRSVMMMAHVYARMGATGTYAERLAASLKQAWTEAKAMAVQAAVRGARHAARCALDVQLADIEVERLAARTVPFSRGIPTVRTGRFQSGRW